MSTAMGYYDLKYDFDEPVGISSGTIQIDRARKFIKDHPESYQKAAVFDETICKNCLQIVKKKDMKTCSQCQIGVYCSRACFLQQWNQHKNMYH